jgi:hypothetical protein
MKDIKVTHTLLEYCCSLEQSNLLLTTLTDDLNEGNRKMKERLERNTKRVERVEMLLALASRQVAESK